MIGRYATNCTVTAILLTLFFAVNSLRAEDAEFEIRTIDSSRTLGKILLLRDDVLQLENLASEADPPSISSISLETVLSIRQASPPELPEPSDFPIRVQLLDGSELYGDVIQSDGATALLSGKSLSNKESSSSISMEHVSSIQFGRRTEQLARQWDEIAAEEHTGDVLVIRKGTDSLDYLAGIVSGIGEENIKFQFDDQEIDVAITKLYGVLYYSKPKSDNAQSASASLVAGVNRFQVASVEVMEGNATWTAQCGAEFTDELSNIQLLDFGADKILYLSDADPAKSKVTPKFGSRLAAELGDFLYAPRRDQGFDGSSLQLRYQSEDRLETHSKGLALHSRTELQYRLNREYSILRAIVGMEPSSSFGNARLKISADGDVLFDQSITSNDEPQPIALDVSGRRRLSILVDYGDKSDIADRLHLCEIRVIK